MKQEPLVVERTYNAPVEKVWSALTDHGLMKQWYFNMKDFKPEVGFEFEFTGEAEGQTFLHKCRVLEVVPERKLKHTWLYEGYEGYSVVTIELFPEGDKTRIRLTHEGLETFPQISKFARGNFEMGWNAILGTNLREFVEEKK
jgi:uncharacterized protein YndB with AHSA1/START domain